MSTLTAQIPRTFIADDQPDVLAALRLILKTEGFQTEAANCPNAGGGAMVREYPALMMITEK